jgi:hypothetical protein
VSGVMKKVRQDLDNVPFLTMAYDGLEQTNTQTRLEAFMHQALQFGLTRSAREKETARVGA